MKTILFEEKVTYYLSIKFIFLLVSVVFFIVSIGLGAYLFEGFNSSYDIIVLIIIVILIFYSIYSFYIFICRKRMIIHSNSISLEYYLFRDIFRKKISFNTIKKIKVFKKPSRIQILCEGSSKHINVVDLNHKDINEIITLFKQMKVPMEIHQ